MGQHEGECSRLELVTVGSHFYPRAAGDGAGSHQQEQEQRVHSVEAELPE